MTRRRRYCETRAMILRYLALGGWRRTRAITDYMQQAFLVDVSASRTMLCTLIREGRIERPTRGYYQQKEHP